MVVLGIASTIGITSCDSPGRGLTGDDWPWGATALEIHGLSRFLHRDGEEILSVRVEFLDKDGDPTKFPGLLEIDVDPEGILDEEERTFRFDLSDLKVNAEYWDHVTSTYRFQLQPNWDEPPLPSTPIRVRAIATISGEGRLSDGVTVHRGD